MATTNTTTTPAAAASSSAGKLEITSGGKIHSLQVLSDILSDYFPISTSNSNSSCLSLVERKYLFGGYSGSNYLVILSDDSKYVIKITNGYSAKHAEQMCRTTYHLKLQKQKQQQQKQNSSDSGKDGSFPDCVMPIPKQQQQQPQPNKSSSSTTTTTESNQDSSFQFVSTKEPDGVPAFLLTYVEGIQADKVMRTSPSLATTVMTEIGSGLARMHLAAASLFPSVVDEIAKHTATLGLRWYQSDGGCCDVQDHVNGIVLDKISKACSVVGDRRSSYLPFYQQELIHLQSEMRLTDQLDHGITHGDPFADNVLVHADTGKLSAFIDIEDICVGPLLFDLACCAIGCCFSSSSTSSSSTDGDDNGRRVVLDYDLLNALLKGYGTERSLPKLEQDHLIAFMRVALLCNCSWRFVKFNTPVSAGAEEFPEQAKDSYLELQHRIEYLKDNTVVSKIEGIITTITTTTIGGGTSSSSSPS